MNCMYCGEKATKNHVCDKCQDYAEKYDAKTEKDTIIEVAVRRARRMGLSVQATSEYVELWLNGWEERLALYGASTRAMDMVREVARESGRHISEYVGED